MDFRELNSKFNFFIGLDQTGAVLDGGTRAKPLPVAWVDARTSTPKLHALTTSGKKLKLESFSQISFEKVLEEELGSSFSSVLSSCQTAILADAVFGLPELTWPNEKPAGAATLRSLFNEAAKDTPNRKGYGLKPAASFFSDILYASSQSLLPVREAERIAGANSLFCTHPFQKNIQCGTYRIWRDLGINGSHWVHLRYFERTKDFRTNRPILFEAYPSLMWREVLKLRTRNRTQIREALRTFKDVDISAETVDLIEDDADHADACVLALGGFWLAQHGGLIADKPSRDPCLAREGWIAGLPQPKGDTSR